MKNASLLLTLALLAGCSSPSGDANAPSTVAEPAMPSASTASPAVQSAVTVGSTSGVVESVDAAAKTITIAHGPVEALKWPAMTMAFKAPNTDLSAIKPGDHVAFEFTASGMNATITKIERQ